MGFFDKMIKNAVSKGIGDAIGSAVKNAVEPKATELANKAAEHIDNAVQNKMPKADPEFEKSKSAFEGAFANLERSVENYATERAKNMKLCPKCQQPTTADKKFCPSCGEKLPDETLADGAICSSCGKQNTVGTKFCQDCGAKLPFAIREEQMAAQKDADVLAEWDRMLSAYPKWNCGGSNYNIEQYDTDTYVFSANFKGDEYAARQAVKQYRELIIANGFRTAGQYPSDEHLYKKVNGVCYHVDTEHCFEGDSDCPSIGFTVSEPTGGFDYVKPAPKQGFDGFKGLFKF